MNKIFVSPCKLTLRSFSLAFKKYSFSGNSLSSLLFLSCAQPFVVLFFYLKIKPDIITYMRFFFGLIIIYFAFNYQIQLSITCFIFFKILDYTDGSIARLSNNKTFYGKFIDSSSDLFIEVFFLLFLGFYFFNLLNDYNFLKLYMGSIIFWIFGQFIYDKYGSLTRWSNFENKKNAIPNIKKIKLQRVILILDDIYFLSFFLMIYNLQFFAPKAAFMLIFSCILFGFINVIIHLMSASRNLRENKK